MKLTLQIRPVRLNKSVYFRVPSDIADLIGLEDDSRVSLTIDERSDRHLLIYSMLKTKQAEDASELEPYSLVEATLQPSSGSRLGSRLH